ARFHTLSGYLGSIKKGSLLFGFFWKEHEGSILFGIPGSRQQKFLMLRFFDVKEQQGIDRELKGIVKLRFFRSMKRIIRLGGRSRQGYNSIMDDTTRTTYLVSRSPSPAIRFKKPIDMLEFFGWLASIKNMGFNESGEYKKTFIGSGVGTGSMQVLHRFEFEVKPLGDHTFEVEPRENIDQGAESNHGVRPHGKANGLLSLVQEIISITLFSTRSNSKKAWRTTYTTTFLKYSPCTHSGPTPTAPTSIVRNTTGRGEEIPQENLDGSAFDATLREYCDKHYNQLLPILAEKCTKRRKDLKKRLGYKHVRSISGSPELRRDRSESPRKKGPERKTVFKRLEKGVFHRLGDNENGMFAYSNDLRRRSYYSSRRDTESCYQSSCSRGAESVPKKNNSKKESSRKTESLSEEEDSAERHSNSRSKRQKSSVEKDDLPQPWVCEETYPFTPRIWYFDFPKTRMPSHIKTYDGSKDPEDHLKIFQAAAKTERWAMPTWCHMFNPTLTKNARVCIKQRDRESTEEFVRRKAVTSNQKAKAKQWERPGKGGKKGGNLRKRQATGNPDGTVMAEGSQTKDYPNLLSGDGDLISSLRGGGWDGRSYNHRGRDGGTLCPSHKPADMTGVPRHIAEHRLNLCEGCLPIRQKKMGHAPERLREIKQSTKK
nr:reverse transcriptase domain-containing protein [Tanacetum cinerariifolium]